MQLIFITSHCVRDLFIRWAFAFLDEHIKDKTKSYKQEDGEGSYFDFNRRGIVGRFWLYTMSTTTRWFFKILCICSWVFTFFWWFKIFCTCSWVFNFNFNWLSWQWTVDNIKRFAEADPYFRQQWSLRCKVIFLISLCFYNNEFWICFIYTQHQSSKCLSSILY